MIYMFLYIYMGWVMCSLIHLSCFGLFGAQGSVGAAAGPGDGKATVGTSPETGTGAAGRRRLRANIAVLPPSPRAPCMQIMPTLGPNVYREGLLWAVWSPRVCSCRCGT